MNQNKITAITIIFCAFVNGNDFTNQRVITVEQDTITLSSIIQNSQSAMLYFWATWCHVCAKETPKMLKLSDEFPKVQFIPVAYPESPEKMKSFIKKKKYKLNTYIDYSGNVFNKFDVKATPTVVILDQNNEVVFNGYKSVRTYKKLLNKLTEK
ncbi:MAG: TlpA family protein disulfide reductase [Bacteroidetes bacterium]|nr:TlpA family protein disulfide reductase [Bacteroidota bacterium]